MKFVRCNERAREKEARTFCVLKCLNTYIFTSKREIERPEYIDSIEVMYMNFVRRNERECERERSPNMWSELWV